MLNKTVLEAYNNYHVGMLDYNNSILLELDEQLESNSINSFLLMVNLI